MSDLMSIYFSSHSLIQSLLQILLFIVALAGVLKLIIFVIRYYIIYTLAKKLTEVLFLKYKKDNLQTPKPEDEKLRSKEAEKIKVEKMQKEIKEEIRLFLPKATGKWQKFVIGSRQNLILAMAQKMRNQKTTNFWQTLVQVQKEQSMGRGSGRDY